MIYELKSHEIDSLHAGANKKDDIDGLLDKFEMIGALVNRDVIDRELAIEAFAGPPALRCWYQLVKYIKEERSDRRGFFLENYEAFTRKTLEYFDKRHIEVDFYEQRADGTIISKVNLVEKLKLDSSLRPRTLKEIQQERDC